MTNQEKHDLARYCKAGYTFLQIRGLVNCSDTTIRRYMKVFSTVQKRGKNG